jgi:hypothetical protein
MHSSGHAWRVRAALISLLVAGSAACAALTGLDQYHASAETLRMGDDASSGLEREASDEAPPDSAPIQEPETETAAVDDAPSPVEAAVDASTDVALFADTIVPEDTRSTDAMEMRDTFVCDSECGAPPPEAGPHPMCVASQCPQTCIAGVQTVCCKDDQTCGCQWSPLAPCM